MKPSFALNLSFEGISLLHRAKGGWRLIGEVGLDDPKLAERLRYMRATATELSGGRFASKLIIPNSQILYRKMDALGATDAQREQKIREGLEGATPYALDELVFDWADAGNGMAWVAAVARQTLREAEEFAAEHRFNPVSFVAIPEPGSFEREPFFGPAAFARTLLSEGEEVEPDPEIIIVLGGADRTEFLEAEPAAEEQPTESEEPAEGLKEKTPAGVEGPAAPGAQPTPGAEPEDGEEEPPAAPSADTPPAEENEAAAEREPAQEAAQEDATSPSEDGEDRPGATPQQGPATAGEETAARIEDGEERRAEPAPPAPEESKAQDGTASGTQAEPAEEPAHREPEEKPAPPAADEPAPPPGDTPPEDGEGWPKKGLFAFATSRLHTSSEAAGPAAARAPAVPPEKAVAALADIAPRIAIQPGTAPAPPEPKKAEITPMPVTAPEVAPEADKPARKRPAPRPGPAAPPPVAPKAPAAPTAPAAPAKPSSGAGPRGLAIFGTPGTGERRLSTAGLAAALVAALLVAALVIGLFLDPPITSPRFWRGQETPAPVLDDATPAAPENPQVTTEPLDEARATPAAPEAAPVEGSASPALPAPAAPDEFAPTPEELADAEGAAAMPVLTTRDAELAYAQSGIWQLAPVPPASLAGGRLEDLYIASVDPLVTVQDAIALPGLPLIGPDTGLAALPPPPPFGTTFALGEDGLVDPTPEGTPTPEGAVVFAGRPEIVPLPRPGGQAGAEPQQTVAELAEPRPRARPGALVQQNQVARLDGVTLEELQQARPRPRPQSPQDRARAEATVTPLNAARRPSPRPGNFSRTVERIRAEERARAEAAARRERERQVAAATAAAAAARTEATSPPEAEAAERPPSTPTTGTVAERATIENAMNLSKINLIGIYGSSSSRRALVRLPNGRFVKVEVGDRLDGGRVVAISDRQLIYVKRGRNIVLKLPAG